MYFIDYVNQRFMDYFNRHLTGIILFKDGIEKISISYELSTSFSRNDCRFFIDVDFFDYDKYSEDEKSKINKYFYNSSWSTGNKFVSFIYKSQNSFWIDVEVVRSFIVHYQFAESVLSESVKNILPAECKLEIQSLESQPFFNYISSYLRHCNNNDFGGISFEKNYKEITKREFDFDCNYHEILKREAVDDLPSYLISDVEIAQEGGGDICGLRRCVLEKQIPFEISSYSNTIDQIHIHEEILEEKMKECIRENERVNVNFSRILELIKMRKVERDEKKLILSKKAAELNLEIGDCIFIEDKNVANENHNMGIVKMMRLSYDDNLEIEYCILKKDLSESKLALKQIKGVDVTYVLKKELFVNDIQNNNIRMKTQLMKCFKEKGIKNKVVKSKKRGTQYW